MSVRRRPVVKLSLAVLALSTIAGCAAPADDEGNEPAGSAAASECPDELTVGALVDSTSYLKSLDDKVLAGIEAGVQQINDNGGVLGGSTIELAVEDMAADPKREVQAFQKVSTQSEPIAFLNGFSSAGNAAIAPLAASAKTPLVVASVVPAENPDWVFSTIVPTTYETGVRSSYLAEQGVERVGVLTDPTPYAKLSVEALTSQLQELGIELTSVEEHATDVVDLRPQVQKLLGGDPDAIIKIGAGPQQVVAAKALADAGSDVPLLIGTESDANIEQADAAYDNVIFVASDPRVYEALPEDERSEALVSLHEQFEGESDLTYVARGFDAANLLVEAIETAGTCDGAAVRDALEEMAAYEGGTAAYDYTADDHYGMSENPLHLATLNDDGTAEIVYTAAS